MNRIEEISARATAATPGPWYTSPLGEVYSGTGMSNDTLVADEALTADALFIAHAREDVPDLLGLLDAVAALHATTFYDRWGRESKEPQGQGGWCHTCGRIYTDACPTMAAIHG